MEYYIVCKCGQRYFIEPKEDSNVFLCSCGKKIVKRNWVEIIEGEFEDGKYSECTNQT